MLRRHADPAPALGDLAALAPTAENRLTLAQRVDYLLGSVQWMNDLVYFGFSVVLLASAIFLIDDGPLGLRPLYGAAVLLPARWSSRGVVVRCGRCASRPGSA